MKRIILSLPILIILSFWIASHLYEIIYCGILSKNGWLFIIESGSIGFVYLIGEGVGRGLNITPITEPDIFQTAAGTLIYGHSGVGFPFWIVLLIYLLALLTPRVRASLTNRVW